MAVAIVRGIQIYNAYDRTYDKSINQISANVLDNIIKPGMNLLKEKK